MGGLKHALNRSSTQLSHDFLVVFTAGDGQTGRVPQERVLAAHQTGSRDQQHTGWRGVLRTGLFMNRPIAEVFKCLKQTLALRTATCDSNICCFKNGPIPAYFFVYFRSFLTTISIIKIEIA